MTAKKILLYAARAAGSLAACALAFAALWRYEYPQQLTQIDNLVGMIPLAFGLLFAGCICALLWMPHGRRTVKSLRPSRTETGWRNVSYVTSGVITHTSCRVKKRV